MTSLCIIIMSPKLTLHALFLPAVCGDGEFVIYTALAWRNKSYGSALEFVWANDSNVFATRYVYWQSSLHQLCGAASISSIVAYLGYG